MFQKIHFFIHVLISSYNIVIQIFRIIPTVFLRFFSAIEINSDTDSKFIHGVFIPNIMLKNIKVLIQILMKTKKALY
jgi:hypothetical protein